MRSLIRWWTVALAVCVLAGAARAADEKAAAPLDRKALDEAVYKSLADVINEAVDYYNNRDPNSCYRMYRGALVAIQPVVDHRPEWQKAITEGLAAAEASPSIPERAVILRRVMDKIRGDVHPPKAPAGPGDKKTLWDRLGGEKGVAKVIDDFVGMTAKNPKVDFTRGGKFKLTDADVAKLKRELVEMVSEASGGPLKYKGPSMKEVHKGMGISDAEMDAMLADLRKALDMNGVKGEDAEAVLKAVDATRKDIVEKKPDETKPEDKKPAGEESVQGKVTYKGKPLPSGTITLVGEKGASGKGMIGEDGSYKLEGLQAGTYKVAVATPKVGDKEPEVKIPAKFADPETSGLTFEVKKGKQMLDIALE